MPYIPQEDRLKFDIPTPSPINKEILGRLVGLYCKNGGDLQYILAMAINTYLQEKGLRYQNCQDIMGALAGAQAEFQRVVVGPYEQEKIEENGAVYTVQNDENGY